LLMISFQEEKSRYYFSCAFLWWVLHGFYRLLEEIETDDMQERLDECELQFEEVGKWLLAEMRKAGLTFQKDHEMVSIHACSRPYERTVIGWFIEIESVSKREYQDIAVQYYYFYYLECE